MIYEESHTDKESRGIKICASVIYVTNVIYTMLRLRNVSTDCGFSIWDCLRPEDVKNI